MARDAQLAARRLPTVGLPVVPFQPGAPQGLVAPGGDVAYAVVTFPEDNDKVADWGKDLRKITDSAKPPGLQVYVTGDVGFSTDAEEVFCERSTQSCCSRQWCSCWCSWGPSTAPR